MRHIFVRLGRLTLGSFVKPDIGHSLMFAGASMEVTLAFSTKGSLIMLTVKFLVDLMLCAVSLSGPAGLTEQEIDISAGLCVTFVSYEPTAPGVMDRRDYHTMLNQLKNN